MVASSWIFDVTPARFYAFGLMALAGLMLTSSNLMVQETMLFFPGHMPILEIVFVRSLVQLIMVVPPLVIVGPALIKASRDTLGFLFLLALTGFLGLVFVLLGVERLPLGDATVIIFTSTIFTGCFSFLILMEVCSVVEVISSFVCFIGVVLVAKPTVIFGQEDVRNYIFVLSRASSNPRMIYVIGIGFLLVGSIFLAMYYVTIRKVTKELHYLWVIFAPSALGVVVSPLILTALGESFVFTSNWRPCLFILMVGVTSFMGLLFMSISLRMEEAGPLILIRNLDVVYAFLFQYALTDTKPVWWSIGGAFLVLIATSVVVLRRCYYSQHQVN